jgi:hypothetical protein
MILYGIKKAVLTELDAATGLVKEGGVVATIKTAEEASLSPVLSEGAEEILRNDTNILAVVRTDDLLYGYDFTFKDNQFDLNSAQLLGGLVVEEGDNVVVKTPMLADGSVLRPFKMELYVANYEMDAIVGYAKITLNKCFGKFPEISIGKEFFAPEFEVKARENSAANLPIFSIEEVQELPADAE